MQCWNCNGVFRDEELACPWCGAPKSRPTGLTYSPQQNFPPAQESYEGFSSSNSDFRDFSEFNDSDHFRDDFEDVNFKPKMSKMVYLFLFIIAILTAFSFVGEFLQSMPKATQKKLALAGIGLAIPIPKVTDIKCDMDKSKMPFPQILARECEVRRVKRRFFVGQVKSVSVSVGATIRNSGGSGQVEVSLSYGGYTQKKVVWFSKNSEMTIHSNFTVGSYGRKCTYLAKPVGHKQDVLVSANIRNEGKSGKMQVVFDVGGVKKKKYVWIDSDESKRVSMSIPTYMGAPKCEVLVLPH